MVSFSCEACGHVFTKKKLDPHRSQCYGASFTCLDCMVHFEGMTYKSHTSCVTEDQKYQGKLYKEKKPKAQHQTKHGAQQQEAQVPAAYHSHVEDAPEPDNAVAVVHAPPRAPTPPPPARSLGYHEQAALPAPNVFDFLDAFETPDPPRAHPPMNESRMIEDNQPPVYVEHEDQHMPTMVDVMKFQVADDDEAFQANGFSYGHDTIRPARERFDSYCTPAPKPKHSRTKSRDTDVEMTTTVKDTNRKRKRNAPAKLSMSLVRAPEQRDVMMADAPPMLHSGLTGGLNRMLTHPTEFPPSPEDSGDYANSPLSPMKRAKQGMSKAFLRANKEWEVQEAKQRKLDIKEERRDRDRGREQHRKERKNNSTALVKTRTKKRRDGSTERRRHRQYSSSVSPPPQGRKTIKAIEYPRSGSVSPEPGPNAHIMLRPGSDLVPISSSMDARAELFMSFITKGPESERGMSVNKALKRFHRERNDRWNPDRPVTKPEEEKELWKNMRLRRNERGEIVLFFSPADS